MGEGMLKDDKEAVKWYRKAAEQGYTNAQYNLGVMYANGEGVLEDDKEAVRWYRKAAEAGNIEAQNNLGIMYINGEGVLQDYVTSYAWANIAGANGYDVKRFKSEYLEKKMTPEQIAEAEALAKKMIKKNPKLLNK
jgi:FOG: TPR repeat, SEL1 subfamily